MPKNDFESTNFANFEEVVHNFGRSDNDKNAYFQYMHTWFDAQLDQKILDGIYSQVAAELNQHGRTSIGI